MRLINLLIVLFQLLVLSTDGKTDKKGIWPTNPVGDSIYESGDVIEVSWAWAEDIQGYSLAEISSVLVQFSTGSDTQNKVISNVTNITDLKKTKFNYTLPKLKYSSKIYFFRFLVIPKDPEQEIKQYWTTRFDIFMGDKGEWLDLPFTSSVDPNAPTKTVEFEKPSNIIKNPRASFATKSFSGSWIQLVFWSVLSAILFLVVI